MSPNDKSELLSLAIKISQKIITLSGYDVYHGLS